MLAGMIGLHVLHHQIIRLAPAQNHGQIIQPFMLKMLIHRVHHGDFLVQDHIGIIGHSVGHGILALKQVYLMIVHACIANIVRNGHKPLPFCQRGEMRTVNLYPSGNQMKRENAFRAGKTFGESGKKQKEV